MYQACYRQKPQIVELLLKHGVTIHFEKYGGKLNPESPFTHKFLSERSEEIQAMIFKYHKLRVVRQFLKMYYFVTKTHKGLPIEIKYSL